MIIDGRKIAEELLNSVADKTAKLSYTPKLGVVTCAPGIETKQYLELKKKKAKQAGIDLVVLELPDTSTTEDCVSCVNRLSENCHGVLVQLPLPPSVDREQVLNAIPVNQDPDGFAYERDERSALPPVVAAIDLIAKKNSLSFKGKKVVVLGNGRLVGQPALQYVEKLDADTILLEKDSDDYFEKIKKAEILITGVGNPHFITNDMVSEGVVVFDAGASEDGGVVVGDVDPKVVEKASLFTPVPGGIGPITVAALLNNLVELVSQ